MNISKSKKHIDRLGRVFFAKRTIRLIWIDFLRFYARLRKIGRKNILPEYDKLHCGCGERKINGWLNVDLMKSDYDIDLLSPLPWQSEAFEVVVSQHVIEHLEFPEEVMPLLHEFNRILTVEGEIWLSCPDLEKICSSYIKYKMKDMIDDRRRMWGEYSMEGVPDQHFINLIFHQHGYHKNMYDFGLLHWMLNETGFKDIKRLSEADLLTCYPEFPKRDDDYESVYVTARKK